MVEPYLTNVLSDFNTFISILLDYLHSVPDSAWEARTGTREKDWTLHQTLAHLVSISHLFNKAARCARDDESLSVNGLARREDLVSWNETEIMRLIQNPPENLIRQLAQSLDEAAAIAKSLTSEQMERPTYLTTYNRPARTIDFIDWQLSHAGVIHAAQMTRPLNLPPLWEHYPEDLLNRQIDRFMRQFSYAYWEAYAGDVNAILSFHIEGPAGGDWHIAAAMDGGFAAQGVGDNPAFILNFANPYVLFGIFTVHIRVDDAIKNGLYTIEGDRTEALRVLRLFGATPPKQ